MSGYLQKKKRGVYRDNRTSTVVGPSVLEPVQVGFGPEWAVEEEHGFFWVLMKHKKKPGLCMMGAPDNKLDCEICGPERRDRQVEELHAAYRAGARHLIVYPSQLTNTVRRQIRRKGGSYDSTPLLVYRVTLSTVPVTLRDAGLSSFLLSKELTYAMFDEIVTRWRSDRSRKRSSGPKGWRIGLGPDLPEKELTRVGFVGRPFRLLESLEASGVFVRTFGAWTEIEGEIGDPKVDAALAAGHFKAVETPAVSADSSATHEGRRSA